MKPLFNKETEAWTPEAQALGLEIQKALRPIIDKVGKKGLAFRELEVIILHEVSALVSYGIIERQRRMRQQP